MRVPMRETLVLAATVAAAASLTACGTVAAPSAGKSEPARTLVALTGRGGPPAGTRAEATALARRMLSRLRLPGGARRLPAQPVPSALRDPALWAGGVAALDQHRLFRLRQPMRAVAAAWTAHAPAGMTLASTGDQSGPSGVLSILVSYNPRSLPAGIDAAQLVLTVTPARSGGSLARADAQVIWFPPRSAAEYIDPSRYHVLTITVTLTNPRAHSLHKVVTSQAAIARLARALNRSPVEPIDFAHCPMIFATYRLAFAVSRHSPAAVVVSATRWPCLGAGIVAGGKSQPSLANAAVVVNTADRLLGDTPQP
jgi:hypothetical protein